MNLNTAYEQALSISTSKDEQYALAHLIDLTQLEDNLDDSAIELLIAKAYIYDVAAICVYPKYLSELRDSTTICLASVLNFPNGLDSLTAVSEQLDRLLSQKLIDELDYVFPYPRYLAGDTKGALLETAHITSQCQNAGVRCKVILETGALGDMQSIYQISRQVLDTGCDFIKTSTGKIPTGATPKAAFAMLTAIVDSGNHAGIKLSGGIQTKEQALFYARLAALICNRPINKTWFRIGASRLLNSL